MTEDKYCVTCDGYKVAENCNMETALIIVKGYFAEYYKEQIVMGIEKCNYNE